MFDRLIDFLKDLPGAGAGRGAKDDEDPRLAAAALLFHVMDADGVRLDVERERLEAALSEAYGISGKDLSELVAAAEEADREAIDLYTFTSVLKRHLDEAARLEFIRLMWQIVFADGELSELEDNVVWRVAELIGVERQERIALRQQAQEAMGASERPSGGE